MCRRGSPYPPLARVKSLRYTFGAQAGAHGETKSKNSHRLTLAEQQSGTVMRPSHLLFAAFLVGAASLPAQAQDYYAITSINFFTSACVSNLAEPAAIRERANRRYQPVKDPGELANYIGNDRKGEAWRLPGRGERRFVLALASDTGACTVFIESANREVVEKEFRQLVERAGQPGVTAALPISGLFDLEPIRLSFLNQPLEMTKEEASTNSPCHLLLPAVPTTVAVGAAELPELVRQSREYAAQLVAAGRPAQILITSGDDHFSILEQLARPDGALAQEVLRLALP